MLTIKNTEVFGLKRAIIASGNPMKMGEINTKEYPHDLSELKVRDVNRAVSLGSNPVGSAHDHYLMGVHVQADILYPQYWTIEAERYNWFEILSSQSKMHKLTLMGKNEDFKGMFNKYVLQSTIDNVKELIDEYNNQKVNEGSKETLYCHFMKCISNLPLGFEMWMTFDTNYLQLKTMYLQRKAHKLIEDWGSFCEWCEELPMFIELTGVKECLIH